MKRLEHARSTGSNKQRVEIVHKIQVQNGDICIAGGDDLKSCLMCVDLTRDL